MAVARWSGEPDELGTRLSERLIVAFQIIFLLLYLLYLIDLLSAAPERVGTPQVAIGSTAIAISTTLALVMSWPRLMPWTYPLVPAVNLAAIASLASLGMTPGIAIALSMFPVIELVIRLGFLGTVLGMIGTVVVTLIALPSALWNDDFSLRTIMGWCATAAAGIAVATLRAKIGALMRISALQAQRAEVLARRAHSDRQVLDVVLNAIPVGVLSVDAEGRPVVVNAWQRELVYECLGVLDIHSARDLVLPFRKRDGVTPLPEELMPLARTLRGEAFENVLLWLATTSRGTRAINVSSRPTFSPENTVTGAVLVFQDVTDNVEALEARDALVSSVSHELRTPLTSIIGYLEMAQDSGSLSGETDDWVDRAHSGAERLLGIVSDLLVAASLRSGNMVLTRRPMDVVEVLSDAVDYIQPQGAKKGIVVSLSAEVAPLIVEGDAKRLRQVFDNLLSNAIKYSPQDSSVEVTETADLHTVRIAFRDHGIGMSEEEIAHATTKFFRSESARASGVEGTGLGLHIAQTVVAGHSGTLAIESAPGEGTTFTVVLPRIGRSVDVVPIAVARG